MSCSVQEPADSRQLPSQTVLLFFRRRYERHAVNCGNRILMKTKIEKNLFDQTNYVQYEATKYKISIK